MDLEARKLNIISYLINIQDIDLFNRIEKSILSVGKSNRIDKFTQEELVKRTKTSESDYSKGNVISQEELAKESEEW